MKIFRQTLLVDGSPIRYEVAGEGEAVICVHGLSESSRVWYRNLPVLAGHYRIYLIDLPGFGSMRRQRKLFELKQCATWLERWMEIMGLESASLIGHSMGGYVSMDLAARRPEKIQRLVLVDSIGIPFGCSARSLVYPALKAIGRTHPSFWPCISYDYLRAGPGMIWRAAQQIVALDEVAALSALRLPILLIWGEQDDLVPLSSGRQLHELLNGSRLSVIPKANHFCMFERPQDFHNILLPFLRGEDADLPSVALDSAR